MRENQKCLYLTVALELYHFQSITSPPSIRTPFCACRCPGGTTTAGCPLKERPGFQQQSNLSMSTIRQRRDHGWDSLEAGTTSQPGQNENSHFTAFECLKNGETEIAKAKQIYHPYPEPTKIQDSRLCQRNL